MQLKEYAGGWLEQAVHLSAGTKEKHRAALESRILPVFGVREIEEIQRSHIKSWIASLVNDDLAPSTVGTLFRTFHVVMAAAVEDEVIPKNPCRGIPLPRNEDTEAPFMTMDEVHALADAVDGRYRMMILLAGYTGMRFSELVALKVEHVNILRAEVRVEQAATEVRGRLTFHAPKTKRSRRTIKIPRWVADDLGHHIGQYPSRDGFVFSGLKGGPIRRSAFRRLAWVPAATKIRLAPEKTFHSIRHGHASALLSAGVPVETVSARLGHARTSITLDVYSHLLPGAEDEAVAALEGLGSGSLR